MKKTRSISLAGVLTFAFVLASAAPTTANMTLVIPDDIIEWQQAVYLPPAEGGPKALLFEEEEEFEQESWIVTKDFNIDAGLQKVSFDMGYYSGGGAETDKFWVWLKDASHNIITPVSPSILFPWKSSEHVGSSAPQPVELFYDSVSGFSDVYLQFFLLADGDMSLLVNGELKYPPTKINISNIQVPTPLFLIPAPGALLLGGVGTVMVGVLRRSKRKLVA